MSNKTIITLGFLVTLPFCKVYAAVNDVFPGDYYPATKGISTFTLYGYAREGLGPYSNGQKLIDGSLDQSIMALRFSRAFEYGGLTLSPIMVLSWLDASSNPAALSQSIGKHTRGFGDARFGLTVWPINDRNNAEYLGLTATVIAPTGSYDSSQVLNFGENRWRLVLSGGYQKDITPRLLYELSPEVVFYSANDNYAGGNKLEQTASFAFTSYLRSRLANGIHPFIGLQLNFGGETRLNGVNQNNPAENNRLSIGTSIFLPHKQQVIIRASKDVSNKNGFRVESDLSARYQISF